MCYKVYPALKPPSWGRDKPPARSRHPPNREATPAATQASTSVTPASLHDTKDLHRHIDVLPSSASFLISGFALGYNVGSAPLVYLHPRSLICDVSFHMTCDASLLIIVGTSVRLPQQAGIL